MLDVMFPWFSRDAPVRRKDHSDEKLDSSSRVTLDSLRLLSKHFSTINLEMRRTLILSH